MERRNFISTAAALAATSTASILLSGQALADDDSKKMAGMHHHAADPKLRRLVDSAVDCVKKGDACLEHCVQQLASGDTSYGGCAKSVREMMIYCKAIGEAANQGSKHLKALAQITLEVCQACETECRKHKEHEVCMACADACVECATQCKATLA